MADDIKNGFPIKSGGYFPRRYLVPRHRAQTLYSAPFKDTVSGKDTVSLKETIPVKAPVAAHPETSLTVDASRTRPRKVASSPLRLQVEQVVNQGATDNTVHRQEALMAFEAPNIRGDES